LERPHGKVYGPVLPTMSGPFMPFDLRDLLKKTRFPYILWMPQQDFLAFLAEEAKRFPSFRLVMGANVSRLVEDCGAVCGVRYRTAEGWHEGQAKLTVAADGRFSKVRKLCGFQPVTTSSPIELLWFRLPRAAGEPESTGIISPRFGKGGVLLTIDRP